MNYQSEPKPVCTNCGAPLCTHEHVANLKEWGGPHHDDGVSDPANERCTRPSKASP